MSPRARHTASSPPSKAPASSSACQRAATGPAIEAVRWASRLLDQLDVRRVASPLLRRLRDDVGETVNLAILRDGSLVYVDILESPSPFRMADSVGAIAPLHATALGKSVAVHLEPTRLAAILGSEPYRDLTSKTPTTWPQLNERLDQARRDGYATDLEEVEIGVACVAAPVLVRGVPIGAISVSAPRARMTDARMAQVGREVLAASPWRSANGSDRPVGRLRPRGRRTARGDRSGTGPDPRPMAGRTRAAVSMTRAPSPDEDVVDAEARWPAA